MNKMNNKIGIILQLILIIALGFAAYANSIKGEFIWDDYSHVKENVYIRKWANIPKVFSENMGMGAGYKAPFYRPLQTATYMLDYSFYNLNPAGFHITNILLHVLVSLAIYWLVNIIFSNQALSLLTSILFVIHPVNTESVSFISDRAEPLATLFILLGMALYTKYLKLKDIKIYIAVMASFILALLSKENSLILPMLLLLYHYVFRVRLRIKDLLPLLIIAAVYVVCRRIIFKTLLFDGVSWSIIIRRIPGFFAAIFDYLKLVILPFNLHIEYSYKIFNFYDPKAIMGAAIAFSLIIYAFIKRKDNALITFAAFWFFIALLPVSNIYPINDSYMAERWLYLPIIGLILIPANGLCVLYNIKRFRSISLLFVISVLFYYTSLTIKQNEYWVEPISFYKKTLEHNPMSWRLYNELGLEYGYAGNYEKAVSVFQKALEINPHILGVYYNLGNAYWALKKEKEAESVYKKAKEVSSTLVKQYHEDANKYIVIGKIKEAIGSYNKALELAPGNLALRIDLGNAYTFTGRYKEAIILFRKVLEAEPNLSIIHNNLAAAYYYNKNYELAIRYCDKAIELGYKVSPKFLGLLKPYRK